jgi:hypothetical protein
MMKQLFPPALLAALCAVPANASETDEQRSISSYGGRATTPTYDSDIILYPVIPGTKSPDLRGDRQIIRDGMIYEAIPGTNTPDFRTPVGKVEGPNE